MMKINDLTIEDLIRVAEDENLTPEQAKKVKAYTLTRLQEYSANTALSAEQKALIKDKIVVYRTDVYGVEDMGYPYVKTKPSERQAPLTEHVSHVDMYCASEPLN